MRVPTRHTPRAGIVASGLAFVIALGGAAAQSAGEARSACATGELVTHEVRPVRAICITPEGESYPATAVVRPRTLRGEAVAEIYRCETADRVQAHIGQFAGGSARFEGEASLDCAEGLSLWREADARLSCRPRGMAAPPTVEELLGGIDSAYRLTELAADRPHCQSPPRAPRKARILNARAPVADPSPNRDASAVYAAA